MSASYRTRSRKAGTCVAITDYLISTYKPQDGACVIMWRELIDSWGLSRDSHYPIWGRDSRIVHTHWKQHGPMVVGILTRRHNLTIVKVSSQIRGLVPHGGEPRLSASRHNPDAYRRCLPNSGSMIMGIVCFPPGAPADHPLIVYSRDQRAKSSATALKTSIVDIGTAATHGVLSSEAAGEIRSHVSPILNGFVTPDMIEPPPPPALPSPDEKAERWVD